MTIIAAPDDGGADTALPDVLKTSDPMVQALYLYWARSRKGRPMPRRADIDPVEIPRHLPNILLVDVHREPLRFVYRVVGTNEEMVRGYNPTGMEVATHWFGPSAEDVLGCYTRVCEAGAPLYDPDPYETPDGLVRQDDMLFLPLSENGETVSQILVYSISRRRF